MEVVVVLVVVVVVVVVVVGAFSECAGPPGVKVKVREPLGYPWALGPRG